MDKIAFLIQRYGAEINGGAEFHCKQLAEHLTDYFDVEIITSTSLMGAPWDNHYREGDEIVNGVLVRRFPVERMRNEVAFRRLDSKIKTGNRSAEKEWFEEMGPFCPKSIQYISSHYSEYKAVILFVYSAYTTYMCLQLDLPNTILIPTAHNEPHIFLQLYAELFMRPKALLFNTIEEQQLVEKVSNISDKKFKVTCTGIDIPLIKNDASIISDLKLEEYVIYVGRVSTSKNYLELNRYFIEYKRRNPGKVKLVVVGRKDNEMEFINSSDIIYTGFISDDERTVLMANARILILPSLMESLSLVILESMAVETPILVNGNCDVLKAQCIRSNAGLYYTNYFEFEKSMDYILGETEAYTAMQNNGKTFVLNDYSWESAVNNVLALIEELGD